MLIVTAISVALTLFCHELSHLCDRIKFFSSGMEIETIAKPKNK